MSKVPQIKELFKSIRIKSVDFHGEQPWVLAAMFDGNVTVWDYEQNVMVKSFEVSSKVQPMNQMPTVPVRTAKFVRGMQWIVCGSDDNVIRVVDFTVGAVVKEWEAHADFIRSIDIHPTQPFILSSSDDKTLKLWDWEDNFQCIKTFRGHEHYVMAAKFNPIHPNTFVSVSLDKAIKFWNIESDVPIFSVDEAHSRGLNCVDYFASENGQFLVTGGDDFSVKIWNVSTNTCIQVLVGHEGNVSSVCFVPGKNVIVSAAEDGSVRMWNGSSFEPEDPVDAGLERPWAMRAMPGANRLAVGYDQGFAIIDLEGSAIAMPGLIEA